MLRFGMELVSSFAFVSDVKGSITAGGKKTKIFNLLATIYECKCYGHKNNIQTLLYV